MPDPPRILAFAGSARRLAQRALLGIAAAGAEALGGQLARFVRSWCAEVRSGSAPP